MCVCVKMKHWEKKTNAKRNGKHFILSHKSESWTSKISSKSPLASEMARQNLTPVQKVQMLLKQLDNKLIFFPPPFTGLSKNAYLCSCFNNAEQPAKDIIVPVLWYNSRRKHSLAEPVLTGTLTGKHTLEKQFVGAFTCSYRRQKSIYNSLMRQSKTLSTKRQAAAAASVLSSLW